MSDEQNNNSSGQYTVDMLIAARNQCFELSDAQALPMAVRSEFSLRYGQLDQLIDELMTKQFHEKASNEDEIESMIRTNSALAKELTALSGADVSRATAQSAMDIVDNMLKIGKPLVEV